GTWAPERIRGCDRENLRSSKPAATNDRGFRPDRPPRGERRRSPDRRLRPSLAAARPAPRRGAGRSQARAPAETQDRDSRAVAKAGVRLPANRKGTGRKRVAPRPDWPSARTGGSGVEAAPQAARGQRPLSAPADRLAATRVRAQTLQAAAGSRSPQAGP